MLNGPFSAQWAEACHHWQHALAAAAFVRGALPLQEWVKIAVVAIVTAVLSSQVTIARLDERITAMQREREFIERKRDEQVAELKRQVDRIEAAVTLMQTERGRAKR